MAESRDSETGGMTSGVTDSIRSTNINANAAPRRNLSPQELAKLNKEINEKIYVELNRQSSEPKTQPIGSLKGLMQDPVSLDFEDMRQLKMQMYPRSVWSSVSKDAIPINVSMVQNAFTHEFTQPYVEEATKEDVDLYNKTMQDTGVYKEAFKLVGEKFGKGAKVFADTEEFEKFENELLDEVVAKVADYAEKSGKEFSDFGIVDLVRYSVAQFAVDNDGNHPEFVPYFMKDMQRKENPLVKEIENFGKVYGPTDGYNYTLNEVLAEWEDKDVEVKFNPNSGQFDGEYTITFKGEPVLLVARDGNYIYDDEENKKGLALEALDEIEDVARSYRMLNGLSEKEFEQLKSMLPVGTHNTHGIHGARSIHGAHNEFDEDDALSIYYFFKNTENGGSKAIDNLVERIEKTKHYDPGKAMQLIGKYMTITKAVGLGDGSDKGDEWTGLKNEVESGKIKPASEYHVSLIGTDDRNGDGNDDNGNAWFNGGLGMALSNRKSTVYGIMTALIGSAAITGYYFGFYLPDQARNPYRRAGMTEAQINNLFKLYPQQNGNASCVDLGTNLARLPTLTENTFKCTDSLKKTNDFADYVAKLSNVSKNAFTEYSNFLFEDYPELLHQRADLMLLGNATETLGGRSGELVGGMTPGNVWSLVTHLHYTPEVVNEIGDLAEALRAKILREDSVWYDRYQQSRTDKAIWENSDWGRIANWRFHKDTNSKYLNHTYMMESFPNATDREERLEKMWIPLTFTFLDFNSAETPQSGWTGLDLLKSNMNVTALRAWRDWILSEYNNRTSQFHKDVRDRFSYKYFGDRAGCGWNNSAMQFQKLIENLSEYTESSEWGREYWKRYYLKDKDLDLLTFIDGFMYEIRARGMGPTAKWSGEGDAIFAIELGAKALGMSVDILYSTPADSNNVIYGPAYPTQHQLRNFIESHPNLFGNYTFTIGSGIGFLSPVEGRIADGARVLDQVEYTEMIRLWTKM